MWYCKAYLINSIKYTGGKYHFFKVLKVPGTTCMTTVK